LISAEFKLGGYGSGIQRDIRERQKEKEKKDNITWCIIIYVYYNTSLLQYFEADF
jgi:hypothetical protein